MKIFYVDAFANEPFKGNPAGVCLLRKPCDADWMQKVASEVNLSETAFLLRQGAVYKLRWFTPKVEVDLCGHATLAGAHVLWEEGFCRRNEKIIFDTLSGRLTAIRADGWITLDFPSEKAESVKAPPGLEEVLGVPFKFVGKNRIDYLLEVESEAMVHNLKPDFAGLAKFDCRGFIVTSKADTKEFDFVSRCFYPRVGVNEDPVTGSAHCALAPFWADRLNKKEMIGYQASLRGGIVRVEVLVNRVLLKGEAVTVMRAELLR